MPTPGWTRVVRRAAAGASKPGGAHRRAPTVVATKGRAGPSGNRNALKHGRYTVAAKLERFAARQTIRELQRLIGLARGPEPDAK
jgi:hypothetical protein